LSKLLKELAQATEGLGSAERAEAIKQIFGAEASAGLTEFTGNRRCIFQSIA
jgi:hypothetical protein